jgi:putative SOS response-associated peptidase YedK
VICSSVAHRFGDLPTEGAEGTLCLVCNHYEKNVEVIGWAVDTANGWAVNADGDVVVPDDLPSFPEHTWPKAQAPVLVQTTTGRSIAAMRWGVRVEIKGERKPLVKFVTNARDDSFAKFTWRFSVADRRCLIPATAYYEPEGPEGGKWEVRFTLKDRPMFFFAGVWDFDPDKTTRSFAMVTTSPNELAAKVQDRMPLVLTDEGAREWLGYTPLEPAVIKRLCAPFDAQAMTSTAQPPPEKKISKSDLKSQGELTLGL